MDQPTNIQRSAAKIRKQAEAVLDRYTDLQWQFDLLQPLLFDPAVIAAWSGGRRRHGFEMMRHQMYRNCVVAYVGCTLDSASDGSIAKVMSILPPGCPLERHLRAEATIIRRPQNFDPVGEELGESIERAYLERQAREREEYDNKLTALRRSWAALRTHPTLAAFDKARNKAFAHVELQGSGISYAPFDIASLGLRWGDIGAMLPQLRECITLMLAVVRDSGFAWEAAQEMSKRHGRGFWAPP